ncbi:DUF397 domain-containing protein [Actinoplanes sp. TRM88002]|uniref:DUF397 domain-containing protein n=1 Tax=Paractinoplanes hotanensis TaxID=2906497 RepID=A0ABT0Y4V5_9ACTN|nr:DUF397 domain-containing protein [Actinoplanes hotanensis]MCM4081070.1 DUF397 domain-containing protein [Actinoplanes hotanensis]
MTDGKTLEPEFRSGCEGGSTCVEVAFVILVRDSKNPDGPVLGFTEAEWRDFTAGVKRGEFDLG